MHKTYMAKKENIEKQWYLIDAAGLPLGRVASEVARLLKGKHKPTYTPHLDMGDYIVVTNASKVVLTGKKAKQKFYYRHSGYPGGLKKMRYDDFLARWPERAFYLAVKRMLPSSRLGRAMLRKLKIYAGSQHPHEAQKPVQWHFKPKRVAES
ncbi:MAG: 50S ribosomal protein L13 [Firmicutes bacterium]|mgnify:CR=1 FL=1|jgi:large subunit ribosomal protein L13|nr:50S ribosomal protein L13 [Bacillota bacterium]